MSFLYIYIFFLFLSVFPSLFFLLRIFCKSVGSNRSNRRYKGSERKNCALRENDNATLYSNLLRNQFDPLFSSQIYNAFFCLFLFFALARRKVIMIIVYLVLWFLLCNTESFVEFFPLRRGVSIQRRSLYFFFL